MRKAFAPPSSLARSLSPILKPRRVVMSQSNFVEMRVCLICAELKPACRKFPAFPSCDHDANTCIDCYVQQATALIEQHHRWNAVTCPACNVAIPPGDLGVILPRHEYTHLDDVVKKAALMQDPNWRWCLAPGCGHGQIHSTPVRSQVIKCVKCDAKSCFNHQVKWHMGYTCAEYDMHHPLSAVTKTNEDTIKKITKACPNCEWRIQKEGGCSHMVCPNCHRTFFWNRLSFDGENQASSAEYVGGPTFSSPGLDGDVENAIMVMEGHATVTNVVSRLEVQAPQLFTPPASILHQRPVLGGLRLPATARPPRVTPLARATPLASASTIRRGPVDLSIRTGRRTHRDTGAHLVGHRRSPRLRNLAGDLDEELRSLRKGIQSVSGDRADMEEKHEQQRLQARVGNEVDRSDDEMIEDDQLQFDPLAGYEHPYEQRRAEREAAATWLPRFDSMETRDSIRGTRPSNMPLGSENDSNRHSIGHPHVTRPARLQNMGSEYSPSLRGGHQKLAGDPILHSTQEQVLGVHEEQIRSLERQNFARGYNDWVGMHLVDNPPVPEAHDQHQRMMELQEAGTRRFLNEQATAEGRVAAKTPGETRRSPRINRIPRELLRVDSTQEDDELEPVLPREWKGSS